MARPAPLTPDDLATIYGDGWRFACDRTRTGRVWSGVDARGTRYEAPDAMSLVGRIARREPVS